ncbi:hypothetical protein CDD81_4538 [Ophiocordyceps australis]|uniref:Uncharacterized protein n=1 Tax=Ophiocordyceps australis TaxID=1399860 RepID=A0A2C5YA14_9HYPO|nr:hypothetical protein CDD81_4538 [Ophiocordyceps australis]
MDSAGVMAALSRVLNYARDTIKDENRRVDPIVQLQIAVAEARARSQHRQSSDLLVLHLHVWMYWDIA